MRKIFIIFAVTMLTASCYQEYDVPIPKEERDYLPAPTRAGIVLNLNDSLMVLGPQLENPYTIATMEEARAQLLEENPDLNIPEITTSHYYVRFAPANDEELHTLLQDTTLHFYDFPLDREIFSGVYYHDPAIADSLPTYQYVSIPAEQWSREYANHEIAHEILESLCIPEDMDDFFDGDSNPGWGGGTITPIIPVDPWIPSPGTGEVGPLNTSLSQEDIIDMLVDRALSITGNLESNSGTTTQSVANTNSSSNESWTPSGRITVYDDIVGSQIPLEGAKVLARVWFTSRVGYTDANGNFTCNGTFKKPANYCIKWERAYWDIRDGNLDQAYYNGPKQSENWTLNITSSSKRSLAYSAIHRALHRIYYRDLGEIYRPNYSKIKVKYLHKNNGRTNGKFTPCGNSPSIKIWGVGNSGIAKKPSFIYSTLCHELAGHGVHRQYNNDYSDLSLQYIESWARCVQYYITYLEYDKLNVLADLNVISPYRTHIEADHEYNFQLWNKAENYDYEYTPIFVDIIDNYNQKILDEENYTSNYPNDLVYFSNMTLLQNIVLNASDFTEVLYGFANALYNPNSSPNIEFLQNLKILFESYGYEAPSDFIF